MKGILKLLAKAKLVDLSENEVQSASESIAGAVGEQTSIQVAPPSEPVSPVALSNEGAAELDVGEEQSFDTIYAAAAIPDSPFPAEKLLRLLDGLKAMDGATRKAAVLAMDAADDNWCIADTIIDAQRKIGALGGHKEYLAGQLRGGEQLAAEKLAEVKADQEISTTAVRQQIAELEQLLERKIAQSTQEASNIEAGLRSAREAVAREVRRMDTEIDRLREIPAQFAAEP